MRTCDNDAPLAIRFRYEFYHSGCSHGDVNIKMLCATVLVWGKAELEVLNTRAFSLVEEGELLSCLP